MYSIVDTGLVEMVQTREFAVEQLMSHEALGRLALGEYPNYVSLPPAAMVKLANPLFDCEVTVRRVATVQAAGNKTWHNFQIKRNPEYKPSEERKAWYHVTGNSCIVEHNKTNRHYLRGLPKGISKEEYFIGGQPASENEVSLIREFKKNLHKDNAFVTLPLDRLENVIDSGGEAE